MDKRILAQKLGIPRKQFTYQMMPKKKEGEGLGPRKAQCNSVGDTRIGKWEGVDWGTGGGKEAYGTFGEGGSWKGEIN